MNFSLTPGSVEQTVTVTGEAPVLDTQDTVVQKILSNPVIEALPIGKSAADYPSLIPGAVAPAGNQDVGGLRGENMSIGTSYNTSAPGASGAWRNVTTLLPARMVKFGVHVDF